MTNEEKEKLLLDTAKDLGEYFDSVILFAYDGGSDTFATYNANSGGITPMRTVVEDWLIEQKQYVKTAADIYQRRELEE